MGIKKISRLAQARHELGITQTDIAQRLGVAQATYMRYEIGTQKPRDVKTLEKISQILRIDIDEIFDNLDMARPQINLKTSFTEIPLIENVENGVLTINENTNLRTLRKTDLIDHDDFIAIKLPGDTLGRLRKGDVALCRPNQPLDANDIAVIEIEEKVKKFIGVNEQSVVQRCYQTCAILEVTKNSIFVDYGDDQTTEILKKNVKDVYKVTAIIFND